MSGDSTTQVYFVEIWAGAGGVTTRSEGHSNGWAKGLGKKPRSPRFGEPVALGVCRFRDAVGNVAGLRPLLAFETPARGAPWTPDIQDNLIFLDMSGI